jgi:hypothetical protein
MSTQTDICWNCGYFDSLPCLCQKDGSLKGYHNTCSDFITYQEIAKITLEKEKKYKIIERQHKLLIKMLKRNIINICEACKDMIECEKCIHKSDRKLIEKMEKELEEML